MKIIVTLITVSLAASSALASGDLIYYLPVLKSSQANLTGFIPPYITIQAPDVSAISGIANNLDAMLTSLMKTLLSLPCGKDLLGLNGNSSAGWNGTGPSFPFPAPNGSSGNDSMFPFPYPPTNYSATPGGPALSASNFSGGLGKIYPPGTPPSRFPEGFAGAPEPCATSSFPDLNSSVRICGVKPGSTITLPKKVTLAQGSGSSMEDLYLLSDVTPSVKQSVANLQAKIGDIIADRRAVSRDLNIGVGSFGFVNGAGFFGYKNLLSLDGNFARVTEAVRSAKVKRGVDASNAALVALHEVATSKSIGWRRGARKIIAMFSDAPGHEPICLRLDNKTTVLDRTVVAQKLLEKGIALVVVNLGDADLPATSSGCNNTTISASGQATYLARTTGGALVANAAQSAVVRSILLGTDSLYQTIKADTSDCSGIEVRFSPSFPMALAPGASIAVQETLVIPRSACVARSMYSCVVRYTASGALYATQKLMLSC